MLVVTVLYAPVESACAGGRVYRGKKRMDVVGHGCVRKRSGGDLLLFCFLEENLEEKKEKIRIFTF